MNHETMSSTTALSDALRRLEETVNVPIVPGELEEWHNGVHRRLEPIAQLWGRVREGHRGLFRQMREVDPELGHRIDELEERDTALGIELGEFQRELSARSPREPEPSNDSSEPAKRLERLRHARLEWIVHGRALVKEVETWFVEAHLRDRGDGD